ncbi:MAG: hypothetical protein M1495_20225 [Bacteroidetes bacterium]|nr:hypothetical protein [Bacteroidota bacterium]MCL6100420.1 hypothetical protein [Bacteroidota bacterium]
MTTAIVRINMKTHKLLQEIKRDSGKTMQEIISKALEHYREIQFWNEVNEAYSKLKASKTAFKDEIEERKLWEKTLSDGIKRN